MSFSNIAFNPTSIRWLAMHTMSLDVECGLTDLIVVFVYPVPTVTSYPVHQPVQYEQYWQVGTSPATLQDHVCFPL